MVQNGFDTRSVELVSLVVIVRRRCDDDAFRLAIGGLRFGCSGERLGHRCEVRFDVGIFNGGGAVVDRCDTLLIDIDGGDLVVL